MQQFDIGQHERVVAVQTAMVGFGEPLDEFPIRRRKKLLLMGGARRQFDQFPKRPELFPGARARETKLNREAVLRGLFAVRLGPANDAQRRARRIQMRRLGGKQPVLQFPHELFLLIGFLDLRKAHQVCVWGQLGRQRPLGAQKQEGEFLEAIAATGRQHARPPVIRGEILAREREPFKIILE